MNPGEAPPARPVTGRLLREAIGRIVGAGQATSDVIDRFVESAPGLGIDLSLLCATLDSTAGDEPRATQACLPVLGAGSTLMLFVSSEGSHRALGRPDRQAVERAEAVRAAVSLTLDRHPGRVALVQALAEPGEAREIAALELAGMRRIAELAYLSRVLRGEESRPAPGPGGEVACVGGEAWPGGVRVRVSRGSDDPGLYRALERSYEATLDCPELAGLRSTRDIVASHRAVGEFDPDRWWVVESEGSAEGCVLVNRCAEQGCFELAYIGLSPRLRGLGLGARLLRGAVAASAGLEREMRCAVDMRNAPARRMYADLGFVDRGRRIALVATPEQIARSSGGGAHV